MTQLNLLPDIKLEYLRAQRRKRLVVGLSSLVSGIFLVIFVFLLLFVRVAQKQHMNAIDKDIETSVAKLKEEKDLDKILTVQNQLTRLPALHNDKQISSRVFDYLTKLTPKQATISEVTLDFENNLINIKGNTDALKTVNKFVDTLKFTEFKVSTEAPLEGRAFSNVVLQSFAVSTEENKADGVVYELQLNFDKAIFANHSPSSKGESTVTLRVPNIISTRSSSQVPDDLFVPQTGQGE